MSYVKQTWVDGLAGGTPISAARLTHIEDGIEDALDVSSTTQTKSGGLTIGGIFSRKSDRDILDVNSFPGVDPYGVTDSTAGILDALAAIASRTHIRGAVSPVSMQSLSFNGDYRTNAPLTFSRSFTELIASGRGARIYNTTSGSDVISINAAGTTSIYHAGIKGIALRGTGTTSRAIYLNYGSHCDFSDLDILEHPGTALYLESTNVLLQGCIFTTVDRLLAQPGNAVSVIYDKGGISNHYKACRIREGEVGFDFLNCDSNIIESPYLESNNRGTALTAIRARSTGANNVQHPLYIVSPYLEANTLFDVDTDIGYRVILENGHSSGGVDAATKTYQSAIKMDGGGSIRNFRGLQTKVSAAKGRVVVEQSGGLIVKPTECDHRDLMPPFRSTARNSATQAWFDTDPSWTTSGTNPPTLAYDSATKFLGQGSKKATFPSGGAGDAFSRALMTNARLTGLVTGDSVFSAIAIKASRAGEHMKLRHTASSAAVDGRQTNFITDTDWIIVPLETTTIAPGGSGNMNLVLEIGTALSASLDLWVGAVASSTSAAVALLNTERGVLALNETAHSKPRWDHFTPATNPDTSGATLAALETEVNELKAVLRSLGGIVT